MRIALGNLNLLSVVYRATKALGPVVSKLLTATCKNFLAVQIVYRCNHIQGKGVSDDQ